MPATTKTPLGASTTNRKWYLDVDTSTSGVASWVPVLGITNRAPNFDNANLEDDSDFDSGGFQSQTKTAAGWAAQATVARKVTAADATAYDPGQEFLRTKSIGKFGPANSVKVRIYEMEPSGPRVEAYFGVAAVSWQEQGGAEQALDTVQFTLTGQGQLAAIAHPDTGAAIPTIASLQFSGAVTATTIPAAGGTAVRITRQPLPRHDRHHVHRHRRAELHRRVRRHDPGHRAGARRRVGHPRRDQRGRRVRRLPDHLRLMALRDLQAFLEDDGLEYPLLAVAFGGPEQVPGRQDVQGAVTGRQDRPVASRRSPTSASAPTGRRPPPGGPRGAEARRRPGTVAVQAGARPGLRRDARRRREVDGPEDGSRRTPT
jgi:hypothetical protein